ncbi:MAG: purine-nucleoside/S-methyl-5-thioadenosine phosphorylase / adenosine deaminase [Solirubrobacteraceae bacterium]|nr:purine-nucleoside/S-methyl-5-thioadenosine phosphorylase / adenosine deaminase [Solirubrobacteraceae bacterium]
MKLPAPFEALGEHIAVTLGDARAVFTTRRGGVSGGPYATLNLGLLTGDDPDHVHANRQRVATMANTSWEHFARGRQVHGATVRRVTEIPAGEPPDPADGQATALTGVPAIVLTADCLPVALVSGGAVAMLHAGWRGLADGVVAEGVSALRDLDGDGPLRAAIGPGAGRCCYEVGDEVHAVFAEHGDAVREGSRLDLKLVARHELEAAGADEVLDVGLCTMCAPASLFFSHRRDGGVTGRQGGMVWRA